MDSRPTAGATLASSGRERVPPRRDQFALDRATRASSTRAALDQGTWRSKDGGVTFTLIKARLSAGDPDRPSFAVTKLRNGKTRMYLVKEWAGVPAARFFRTDDAAASVPVFTDLTTTQNINYCTGQCWYDNVVYSPPGRPDVVYLGGSFDYNKLCLYQQRPCVHIFDGWRN